jgi:hypothetical protein
LVPYYEIEFDFGGFNIQDQHTGQNRMTAGEG